MKSEMLRISEDSDFKIETLEVDKDHLHLLVEANPNVSVLQIVRKLKQESTIAVLRQFAQMLSKQFWKERTFWTDGYFASTIGDASEETVRRYIESQG
jgi:putative transposase